MKICYSWAVAVVYLLEKGGAYFHDIVDFIIKTDVTELGERGNTPDKTMWSTLTQKVIDGSPVFNEEGDQYFSLYDEDEMREHSEVRLVYEKLEQKRNMDNIIKENHQLKAKLQSIKQLCEET